MVLSIRRPSCEARLWDESRFPLSNTTLPTPSVNIPSFGRFGRAHGGEGAGFRGRTYYTHRDDQELLRARLPGLPECSAGICSCSPRLPRLSFCRRSTRPAPTVASQLASSQATTTVLYFLPLPRPPAMQIINANLSFNALSLLARPLDQIHSPARLKLYIFSACRHRSRPSLARSLWYCTW